MSTRDKEEQLSMRYIFIVNPIAGRSDYTEELRETILKLQDAGGIEKYEILSTEYSGHARKLAREKAEQYLDIEQGVRIYSCGGDGTLNEVMQGVYDCNYHAKYDLLEVGCIPCGTGNDFIKNFLDKKEFMNLEKQLNGKSKAIDLLHTQRGISASICSLGFDANVGYTTTRYKKMPFCNGKMAYNMAVLECLLKPISTYLNIHVDEEVYEGEFLLACIANGTTYGGGFRSAPEASVEDGLMDVILVKKISRLFIAKVIAKYSKGEHIIKGEVIPELQSYMIYKKARTVSVEGQYPFVFNRDGECEKQQSIQVDIKEKVLSFIVPN